MDQRVAHFVFFPQRKGGFPADVPGDGNVVCVCSSAVSRTRASIQASAPTAKSGRFRLPRPASEADDRYSSTVILPPCCLNGQFPRPVGASSLIQAFEELHSDYGGFVPRRSFATARAIFSLPCEFTPEATQAISCGAVSQPCEVVICLEGALAVKPWLRGHEGDR